MHNEVKSRFVCTHVGGLSSKFRIQMLQNVSQLFEIEILFFLSS